MRTVQPLAAGLRRLGIVAIATEWASGCGGSSCKCDSADDAAFAPKVASLEAGLEEVQVIPPVSPWPDRRFQLTAWYRDADGKIISGRFNPMKWSFTPAGDGSVEEGRVAVTTFPTSASTGATAKAEKDDDASISDEVMVTRWANAAAPAAKGDVVVAEHDRDKPPSVVLLEESDGTACTWGRAWAFVGAAGVGEQSHNPCSLSLLSADRAMVFQETVPTSWAANGTSRTVGLTARTTLNVRVFIAVTGHTASILSGIPLSNSAQLATDVADAAAAQAKTDLDWANMVLEANRVGIVLNPSFKILEPTTPDLEAKVGAQPYDCNVLPMNMSVNEKNPADPAFAYDQNTLSIYYVDWIDYPTDPLHPGSRGINCHWTTGSVVAAPIIYVSYTRHSSITLAHELGHVLGLNDEEATLGEINVMHNLAPDGSLGADARSRLTVGQVFRENIWEDSWLPRTTSGPTRFCDATSPCPPVTIDAR
jgi:hypothetical protein